MWLFRFCCVEALTNIRIILQDGSAASLEVPSGNEEEQEQETLSEPSYDDDNDDEFSTTKEADEDADDLLDF